MVLEVKTSLKDEHSEFVHIQGIEGVRLPSLVGEVTGTAGVFWVVCG